MRGFGGQGGTRKVTKGGTQGHETGSGDGRRDVGTCTETRRIGDKTLRSGNRRRGTGNRMRGKHTGSVEEMGEGSIHNS